MTSTRVRCVCEHCSSRSAENSVRLKLQRQLRLNGKPEKLKQPEKPSWYAHRVPHKRRRGLSTFELELFHACWVDFVVDAHDKADLVAMRHVSYSMLNLQAFTDKKESVLLLHPSCDNAPLSWLSPALFGAASARSFGPTESAYCAALQAALPCSGLALARS